MLKFTLCAVLAAWAFSASVHAAPKNPDTFTYLTISDSDSLDPAWSYDVSSHAIILNVYETLFMYDHGSTEKLLPILAEKVPTRENGLISADGRTYTIPIRAGVKFHDGTTVTAEDARYSIVRFILADRRSHESLPHGSCTRPIVIRTPRNMVGNPWRTWGLSIGATAAG